MGVTKIEWTATHHADGTISPGYTANLWWGCEEVHSGCDQCYARIFARAKGKATAWQGTRFAVAGIWDNLLKWQRIAEKAGEVHRVFCGSMMDIFEKSRPASDWSGRPLGITTGEIRDRFFREVVPATPNLLYLLLTKRPGNATKMVPPAWLDRWPPNVMTGASVVDQPTADTLIPQLLRVPGLRFVSYEPALGPVYLCGYLPSRRPLDDDPWEYKCWTDEPRLHWIIVGGESHRERGKARPFDLWWARSIIAQGRRAGVPVFMKQVGSNPYSRIYADGSDREMLMLRTNDSKGGDMAEWPEDIRVREFPSVSMEARA